MRCRAVLTIAVLLGFSTLVARVADANQNQDVPKPQAEKASSNRLPQISIDHDNVIINKSVRIKPGRHIVADTDGNGVLQITADNVVVDFHGAVLASRKNAEEGDKQQYDGTGLAINGHNHVTIKNARIHGYRYNLRAENCKDLRVEKCDVSHSRAQRISRNGEPIDIFLDLRHVDAWREYGSAIWLERCGDCRITGCRAGGSQNGICLRSSNECTLHDNDMSFNSGWGVALSSSRNNVVSWNHCDFLNRPCQRGGGDNAAIVVVDDSHGNYIVGNSMTYSGDGFFLTDGENHGVRPSNDNVIALNDGSWADANAFEGTFSERNVYYKNLANDSRYGFWLGWSSNNLLLENTIERNSIDGIAWSDGQDNRIEENTIRSSARAAIHLWVGELGVGNSRRYTISQNVIQNASVAMLLENTSDYFIEGNRLQNAPLPQGFTSTLKARIGMARQAFEDMGAAKRVEEIAKTKPKSFKYFREQSRYQGRDLIRFGNFAPYDIRGSIRSKRP